MAARRTGFGISTLAGLVLACLPVPAIAQPAPLAQLQFDIVGVRLVVDPPALTVPKNIATQINTSLALPPGAGSSAPAAIAQLVQGAVVEAQLRGPEIPPTTFRVQPGQPIPLPAFALPGDYFLDGIRLVKDGVPVLDAQTVDGRPATTIPIRVIGEILVASVTSRPLSLDEIRSRGIVIDETNFRTVNFQVAFNIDGQPFTIDLPAALPTPGLLQTPAERERVRVQLAAINRQLQATLTPLPPQLDRPGLNFSIAALPFYPVLQEDEEPGFEIPPITGLVIIPGNVAYLNQFFSVMLMVTNVAPDGTPLVVRSVTGTITLPAGLDRVAGTYDVPGDDPLRLARLEGGGAQDTLPVQEAGPDGEFGTADDLDVLAPQRMGQGEFLVEGLKEGGHTFDIRIRGTLEGLPSGPVLVEGLAAGAVFVRNPSFSVSLAHPRTIRAGEEYDLFATVTNTSLSTANLVGVGLDPFAISGAELLSDPQVQFETIVSGGSAVARFRMRAQRTGEVTFSSFTGDAPGDIRLTTGVGERGVPLAPNAIVLPRTTDRLPASLVIAAQRVLGQALSIATAPAGSLPPDVLFVRKATVIDRGIALAEAGQRVQFGGAVELERALRDLALDWLGGRSFDEGFDQLLRTTEAGSGFLGEVAAILGPSFVADPLGAQQAFAQSTVGRGPQLTVAGGSAGGGGPPLVVGITRDDGATADPFGNAIPSAGVFLFGEPPTASFTALARPEATRYIVTAVANDAGLFDLGVVVPGAAAGQLSQLRFAGLQLDAGGVATVVIDLTGPATFQLRLDRNGDGNFDETRDPTTTGIVEQPPQVVEVVQLDSSFYDSPGSLLDPATYGLLVGVLFDKPVTEATAEATSNYTLDGGNSVIGAQLQPSGRLAYLYLQRPVGGLVERSLTIQGVTDERGAAVVTATRAIRTDRTDGVRVFGQAREADGTPVAETFISLIRPGLPSFTIAVIRADAAGRFEFDFVPLVAGSFMITAQHPRSGERVSLTNRMRGAGDTMLVNPTFLGKGRVRGRILASDGVTPVAGADVALIPGSVMSTLGLQTRANALGEYVFSNIDVGGFTIVARDRTGQAGRAAGLLASAGQEVTFDVVLVDRPDDGGLVVGRVFLSDGVTPAVGFPVYIGAYSRRDSAIGAVDQTSTDDTGSFAFSTYIPPQGFDVVAVDPGSGQVGVARVTVVARTTTSLSIVMEATGTVEGVVFSAGGQPVAGALVAGGLALVETDANGFFRVTDVPAGRRTMQAGDPVSRRRGSAEVDVLPGQTVTAAITLEARATVRGRVLDVNGVPVPFASVRIPSGEGFTFVIANSQGVYTFPDLPLGDYLIQAPGPSRESLVSFMEANGIDPNSAFTSGDGPGSPAPLTSQDAQAVIAAYQQAVQNFLRVDESLLAPPPMADMGGFGYTRARVFQDGLTVLRDVRFLSQGFVAGNTRDSNGLPTGALVRIRGLKVGVKGHPLFFELERKNSDAQSGAFRFERVPRFDQETFQTAGVRGGDFEVQAATPFSPVIVSVFGQLNTATPNIDNLVVQFPAAAETNGTISGLVLMPDGVTPAPQGTAVHISFGDLTVTTRADGTFDSPLPIPAGGYTVTAQSPAGGLRGQVSAMVPAGGHVAVRIRLLGLGSVSVQVQRPGGGIVSGAAVELTRGTFPGERLQGVTDAQGRVRFVNVSEGPFGVEATEAVTGLRGRSSAVATRDVEVATLVTIMASGRVTGTFFDAEGQHPIPFAQVTLRSGAIEAYATTDTSGRFEMNAIPVGAFDVEAVDPASARRGRASAQLAFEGQAVDVTVLQLPRGSVAGFVLDADGASRIAGATIKIRSGSFVPTELLATTRPDGSFRFDGVPAGSFTLDAEDPVTGAKGTERGSLAVEGETVDLNVVLEPFGAIRVTVRDAGGALVTNASVSVSGGRLTAARMGVVDAGGQVLFEHLTLGSYTVDARSLADERDAGRSQVEIESANTQADVTVSLGGVGPLTVDVQGAAGTPVASARVTVHARGGFSQTGPAAGTIVGFTDGSGRVVFPSVPVGDYTVRAESGPLAGAASGAIAAPGQPSIATVSLGAAGSIVGRVLLPGGAVPAAQALVTLTFQSQSSLQSGTLQLTTGLNGTFEFTGVPLGAIAIHAFEIVSQGVRARRASLETQGQVLDLGDLTLDNEAPRVESIDPADGTSNVDAGSPVRVTFNEPMGLASFTADNVRLLLGAAPVAFTRTLSADGRTLTLTSSSMLLGGTRYTVTILGAPGGPTDESAISLIDPFVSTFTVRDNLPPVVSSTSPASNAVQVLPEATVRVTFSEAVMAASLVLRDAAGQEVPGTAALGVGNTVVVFSPQAFLRANTTYSFAVSGVTDLAGNPLAGGPFSASFATVDTIAPLIQALQVIGTPRAGSTVTLQPSMAAIDVARVEYTPAAGSPVSVSTPPFALALALPTGVETTSVAAVAVDHVGNRSAAFTLPIAIAQNAPPSVQLINVSGATDVAQGQVVQFDVVATDDAAVAQVLFSASGVTAFSETRTVPGGTTSATVRFTVTVPSTAPSTGSLVVQAAALDGAGSRSGTATVALPMRDGRQPLVTIVSPATGATVVPGESFTVVVDATDDGALVSMTLACTPALAGCESRTLAGSSTQQTFTVAVPASLQAPAQVVLVASATDAAGNLGTAGRSVGLADLVAPAVTSLTTASGATRVLPGETVPLSAVATDNVAVQSVVFTATSGTFTASQTVNTTGTPATATFDLALPADLPPTGTLTVTARARDLAGNESELASLALAIGDTAPPAIVTLQPDEGVEVASGASITFRVRATDDTGVRRIVFRARGAITFDETVNLAISQPVIEHAVTIPVPSATAPGVVTLSAEAVDAAGTSSPTTTRTVSVADRTAPASSISSPQADAAFDPRQPIAVTVEASDNLALSHVALSVSLPGQPATLVEQRAIAPSATPRTEVFQVTVQPPAVATTLTLRPSARDTSGNESAGATRTIQLLDVVAPTLASLDPPDGAEGVDTNTAVTIQFSEPMDPATLVAANLVWRQGGDVVPAAVSVTAGNTVATITPATRPLDVNTLFTIVLGAGLRDAAGNAFAERSFTFRTASPDTDAPRVESIAPPDNAVGVPATTTIDVTFTEPVRRTSVTPLSFRVVVNAEVVAGTFAFLDGDRRVRFAPAQPLPFEATVLTELTPDITDTSNNALANADGTPLAGPLSFTFLTGNFAITQPAGDTVIENTGITLAAEAGASLAPASVVFSVNAVAQPADTAAPFSVGFNVPAAATAPTLVIVASARDASNVEVARAEKTVTVVAGLRVTPTLAGIPRGGTRTLRLSIAAPSNDDLAVTVSPADAAVATVSPANVTIPAGQTSAEVTVTACSTCPTDDPARQDEALGNTAIVATSARGSASAVVSVSDPVVGREVTAFEQVGASLSQAPSLGHILLPAGRTYVTLAQLLSTAGASSTPVTVSSSNLAVVSGTATDVLPGQLTTTLTVEALADGIATLTLRAGDDVRAVTVIVGTPPAGFTPLALAPAVGASVVAAPSVGQLVLQAGQGAQTVVILLGAPLDGTTPLPVTVTSSQPGVATATASPVEPGSQVTSLAISAVADGTAELMLRAGDSVRSLLVIVGTPTADRTPPVLAMPVGASVTGFPFIGKAFVPAAQGVNLGVWLLPEPRSSATDVSVTSNRPDVVAVTQAVVSIPAGELIVPLSLSAGAPGTAMLTLRTADLVREFEIVVGGAPTPSNTPVTSALPVGASVVPLPGIGRLAVTPGAPVSATVGVSVATAAATGDRTVTVTTSDASIVSLGAGSSVTLVLPAGATVLNVGLATSGATGAAVLTIEIDGVRRELLVVVGNVPDAQLPAITAPVIGVSIP